MYLFIMKKIPLWILFYILLALFDFSISYAAVWDKELATSKENIWIIAAFFNTQVLLNIVFAGITILATFALSKIVSWKLTVYIENMGSAEWTNREELIWVITRTVNIAILVIWFSITLSILWVDMGIFMGWLWFWIWFTLKIFLSNFIAWIIMVTQWTYHNWDLIEVWGKMWNIRRIHSLFTEIEQFDGVVYFVPNVKFLEDNVSNYHSNSKRRVEIEVWVDYATDIVKAKQVMSQVIEQFPNVLKAPYPDIIVNKLDNSSIQLLLRFWIDSKDEYFTMKSNVTETINLAFKQADITIPFPQVTISNRK